MGRTLYSQAYAPSAPAIRTEPEPQVDGCERWNVLNRFDPDSEDFFQDAEYEAFVDPVQLAREQAEMAALAAAEGSSETSESTDSAASDQGSPMAVGSDDPAILIANAYTSRNPPWADADNMEATSLSPPPEWPTSAGRNFRREYWDESVTVERSEIPAFIPPASLRAPSPDIEMMRSRDYNLFDAPPITVRRTVNITPIPVGRTSANSGMRSPSPESLAVPPSRSPIPFPFEPAQHLLSPSPPPSVTPRIYSWPYYQVSPVPTSPTPARGSRDGPLTNPRARISFARIDSAPVPIRVTSFVM